MLHSFCLWEVSGLTAFLRLMLLLQVQCYPLLSQVKLVLSLLVSSYLRDIISVLYPRCCWLLSIPTVHPSPYFVNILILCFIYCLLVLSSGTMITYVLTLWDFARKSHVGSCKNVTEKIRNLQKKKKKEQENFINLHFNFWEFVPIDKMIDQNRLADKNGENLILCNLGVSRAS